MKEMANKIKISSRLTTESEEMLGSSLLYCMCVDTVDVLDLATMECVVVLYVANHKMNFADKADFAKPNRTII